MNTLESLLTRAVVIMNEKRKKLNTNTRIGSLFRDILSFFQNAILGIILKGSLANAAEIQAVAVKSKGDTYRAIDTGHFWSFDGAMWNDIGDIIPSNVATKDDIARLERIINISTRQTIGSTSTPNLYPLDNNLWVGQSTQANKDSTIGEIKFTNGMSKIDVFVTEMADAGTMRLISKYNSIVVNGNSIDLSAMSIRVMKNQFVGVRAENGNIFYGGGNDKVFYFPGGSLVGAITASFITGIEIACEINLMNENTIKDIIDSIENDINLLKTPKTQSSWRTLGDSITWYDSHPNGSSITKGYQSRVAEKISFSSISNQGVSGWKMTDQADNISNISVADLYTVMFGTNDYFNDPIQQLGTISDYIGKTYSNEKTFYGAIREIVDGIYSKNANAKIVFITPIWSDRSISFGGINTPNSAGYTLRNYADAIKECCSAYAIPVIDLFGKSQINRSNVSLYTIDGIHPNDAGFQLMANCIVPVLKEVLGL